MKPVQVMMDEDLLRALDLASKRLRSDRSKLVREAVARFLAAEEARAKESRTIEAYRKKPLTREEREWLGASAWPKD